VAGVEYSLGSAQLEAEYALDWSKGESADTYRHRLVCIVSWDLGDRVDLKLAALYDFADSGSAATSLIAGYKLADGLRLEGDAYVFLGSDSSAYGAYVKNSQGSVSLKYSF
jgi:hypothetical protein